MDHPHNYRDLTGSRFGRLLVTAQTGKRDFACGKSHYLYRCVCDCGQEIVKGANHLRSGHIRSCGCLRKEVSANKNLTHGASRRGKHTPEYRAWMHAKDRCYNANDQYYHRYGGRGIVMCTEWLESFEVFLEDMGVRPLGRLSIDRIDNDGPYAPYNCRWATSEVQSRNKSTNRMIEAFGERLCLAAWAERSGIRRETIRDRIEYGWAPEHAVSKPVRK